VQAPRASKKQGYQVARSEKDGKSIENEEGKILITKTRPVRKLAIKGPGKAVKNGSRQTPPALDPPFALK